MHFGGGKSYIHAFNIHVIAVINSFNASPSRPYPNTKISKAVCSCVLHKHIQAIVSLCYPMQN